MMQYSEDLAFFLKLTDLIRVGGITSEQHKRIADLILEEQPDVVVETGVCVGSSTVVILEALKQLGKGLLYSIDDMSLVKKFTGCYITEDLLERWIFIQDKSKNYLNYLDNNFVVDIFLHDSDHSHENMTWEYLWALNHIRSNGWIVSHDTHTNNAWEEFSEKNKNMIVESFQLSSLAGIRIRR